MSNITLVLLAAGSSSRFKLDVKKQWLRVGHKPLWLFVADRFESSGFFSKIVITTSADDIDFMNMYNSDYTIVEGSTTRQKSLLKAMEYVNTKFVLVSDVARACISSEFLNKIISQKDVADSIVPYLKVTDTIVYDNKTIDRNLVKRVQTPQLSYTKILKEALKTDIEYTDESSAIVAYGGKRHFILGEDDAHKITYIYDLKQLPCLEKPSSDILSGNGFDVHQFEDNKEMFLCGVKIDSDFGFKAHSDGDVAIHALIDALLGASGFSDIGMLFPDNNATYKNIDSKILLNKVIIKLLSYGFEIVNVDITIAAQKPKIAKYKLQMRKVLANILNIDMARVNVKATTTEKLGFIGRAEGIAVWANANLKYFDWTKVRK